jgi:hypothetical protein
MSKFTQKLIDNYKERNEWRRTHLPWLWKAQNSIISLISYCETFIVFLAVVFLCLSIFVFVIAIFESFNVQLLIGIAGVVLFAVLTIPKTRRSLILRPEPAKYIDRIIVTSFMGFILFFVGASGLPAPSSSYSSSSTSYKTSSFESDWEKERKEKEKKQYKQDVKEENKSQREFYSQLSAPKILYKCKNEDFEHAYGVNIGTYNRLLEKAIEDCGEDNLKIIKNEK